MLFHFAPIVCVGEVCVSSLFYCAVFSVLSSFAINLLVAMLLLSSFDVMWVCGSSLQCCGLIVPFSGHTHLLF